MHSADRRLDGTTSEAWLAASEVGTSVSNATSDTADPDPEPEHSPLPGIVSENEEAALSIGTNVTPAQAKTSYYGTPWRSRS